MFYSTTGLVSVPIPSMVHSTTSPGFKNFGGVKPIPAPAGVPVAMMVPGFNVMPFEKLTDDVVNTKDQQFCVAVLSQFPVDTGPG